MSDSNLSAVLYKKGDLRMEDRPIPEPKEGEVQISIRKVGICGSDVHYWQHGRVGDRFVVTGPMLLGHECAGVISDVGPGVEHLKIGDRVAIEPGIPCRTCDSCKTGRYNLCQGVFFLATPPDSGALARYHVHAADFVFKLPDNVSFEEGALIEPLSVGLHAARRAGVTLGSRVLVCGAGPIGLCALLSAKALGASSVVITDLDQKRLDFAKEVGATHPLLINCKCPEDFSKHLCEVVGGNVDHTIECSGAEFSVQLGILATKPGGTMAIVGHGPNYVQFPVVDTVAKEIDIRGSFRYKNTWPTAIAMVASGKINVKPLVSHNFTLEETLKAMETAKSGVGIKVMIDCSRQED